MQEPLPQQIRLPRRDTPRAANGWLLGQSATCVLINEFILQAWAGELPLRFSVCLCPVLRLAPRSFGPETARARILIPFQQFPCPGRKGYPQPVIAFLTSFAYWKARGEWTSAWAPCLSCHDFETATLGKYFNSIWLYSIGLQEDHQTKTVSLPAQFPRPGGFPGSPLQRGGQQRAS